MTTIYIDELSITKKKFLSPRHAILSFQLNDKYLKFQPGQFVNILIDSKFSKILRRPFSIFDVDEQNQSLSIFIKAIGDGSSYIYHKNIGDTLDIIYPLGNSFTICENKQVLLVAGGFGVAPLYFLSKKLLRFSNDICLLIGADTAKNIHLTNYFHPKIKVFITTEDASLGEKGMVTEHSILKKSNFEHIYTSGPLQMMKAIAAYAKKKKAVCEVSIDNLMACGFGTCLCCVVKTIDGNVRSCIDGPVYNTEKLLW